MEQNNNVGNQILGMASGAATGAVMDSFLGGARSQTQQQHNAAIIAQQEASQKRMTKFNSDEAYKQWLRTGDKARAQQLREAGLNVGLMYEGAGGGGSATVSTGGASGGSYEQTNNTGMAMQIGTQMAMQQAQIDLIKAQAKNVEADTENKVGIERDEAQR